MKHFGTGTRLVTVFTTLLVAVTVTSTGLGQDGETWKFSGASSAEQSSFDRVTRHLDPGGNFYLYMSTDAWGKNLLSQLGQLQGALVSQISSDRERRQATSVFGLIGRAVSDSGLLELDGVGMSSIAREPGLYYNKTVCHHKPGDATGLGWRLIGTRASALDGLRMCPADTAMAAYGQLDLNLLWQWWGSLVANAGVPELIEAHHEMLEKCYEQGVDLNQFIGSSAGELGLVVTLSPDRKCQIPVDRNRIVTIPEPAALAVARVKHDAVFRFLEQMARAQPEGLTVHTVNDVRFISARQDLGAPVPLQPVLAMYKDYLMLATHANIVNSVIAVMSGQSNGLTAQPEFRKLSRGVPETGVSFSYISAAFSQTLMAAAAEAVPEHEDAAALIKGMLTAREPFVLYSVCAMTDEGPVWVGNSSMSAGQALAAQGAVAPTAIMAGMLLPALSQSRTKARRINDAGNLKQIGLGLRMYSSDHDDRFPDDLGKLFDDGYLTSGRVYTCPAVQTTQPPTSGDDIRAGRCDYLYFGKGATERTHGTDSPIACTKPGLMGGQFLNVLYADGHVKGYASPPANVLQLIQSMQGQR